MSFLQQFFTGIRYYPAALRFIFKERMAWYFIFPILFNILLFAGGFVLVQSLIETAQTAFKSWLTFENSEGFLYQYLDGFFAGLIWLLLEIIFFIVFILVSGFLVLTLMSPVLAFISEETEKILRNSDYPFSWKHLFLDTWRGILIALRNFIMEMAVVVLMLFVGLIPVVQLAAPIVLLLTSSYFYGFSFIDYYSERQRLSLKQSVSYVRRHKGLAIGNGIVFALPLMIPYIGASIAGFVSIISVVAAMLSIDSIEKQQKK